MRIPRARRARGAALAVVVAAGITVAAGSPAGGSTGEMPGDAAIAASITFFTTQGSITVFQLPGSVTSLREETSRGPTVTVSVNSDILFDFGRATLTAEAVAEIDAEAARIPRGAGVVVDGYTDAVGTDAANLVLSRQRAQAVAARVHAARPDLRVTAAGHGEADPVAANSVGGRDNPAGRARNRRVTLTFSR